MAMASSQMHWLVLIVSIISAIGVGHARSVIRSTPNVKRLNLSENDLVPPGVHEYAAVGLTGGTFMGASAKINVWNPTVVSPEVSFSQIWLEAGPPESLNTVEAGWLKDGYQSTGCYDLNCKGFVPQKDTRFTPGRPLAPVSTYNGQQYDITMAIKKDPVTGDWWLHIENEKVGHWPKDLFTHLKEGPASAVHWGGEIVNTEPGHRHTSTQMGSGHFPSEGFGNASYFRGLKFIDDKFNERDPENLKMVVTKPKCYDLLLNVDRPEEVGVNFYYGGPGLSPQCQK
ncbi:hypothetical protein NL676_006703 [Syzygium grande]|nr:hypothetical protein NL676_006703 [Syzygium grande]